MYDGGKPSKVSNGPKFLWPYTVSIQLQVSVLLCCVHSLISVIDKLLTYIYTCAAATGFYSTFKLIREELMSSTHYRETWNSSKACRTCSKGSFNHSCAISVSFNDFQGYQVMKNLANHFPCRAGFGSGSSAWLTVSVMRSWPLVGFR
jgi:hypothetical protein